MNYSELVKMVNEYPLYYKDAITACPSARYVGGTSRNLCECKDPENCAGVQLAAKRFNQGAELRAAGIVFNRCARMADNCTHSEYWLQFVNAWLIQSVGSAIGIKRIANSRDIHLNDIPLSEWDRLSVPAVTRRLISLSNATTTTGAIPTFSQSDLVCVVKAAAHLIRREHGITGHWSAVAHYATDRGRIAGSVPVSVQGTIEDLIEQCQFVSVNGEQKPVTAIRDVEFKKGE